MRRYERSWWWWVKEKKQMALVFIAITMLLQFQMKGCEGCVETERMGLLQLKSYVKSLRSPEVESFLKTLSPEEGSVLETWSDDDRSSDCCHWERVKCSDATGGHIIHLSLDRLIPRYPRQPQPLNLSLLHSFPQLKTLNFSRNYFTHLFDPIHGTLLPLFKEAIINIFFNFSPVIFFTVSGYKSFQRLKNLETLDLSYNILNFNILPFLSVARSLRNLNLGNNDLGAVYPPNGYKIFQKLENLETLDLFFNQLNNSVLHFLSAATSLRNLNLRDNRLKGVFPPNELANMTKLRVLNLGVNEFSFFSVKALINLRELEVLNLRDNRIKEVETGDGLTMTNLKTLDLSFNHISQLKGLTMTNLKTLDLSFNHISQLKGLQYLLELQVLSLAFNKFNDSGSIILKDMPKLQELDLSWNYFTDLDSLGLVFPSSLQVLNLRLNQLSSTPKGYSEICRLMYLREIDLSRNSLTSMPYCLGTLTRLRTLDLSYNYLNGNLSSLVSRLPSTLEYLSLLDNNFNGSFCFNSLANHTRLKIFKLSSRVGTIQDMTKRLWVPLFQLKMLKLQNFSLGSTIPGFLVHQHDLFFIDLSYNNLTGAFPTWLVQNNTKLQMFLLNNNSLTKLQLPRLVHGLQFLDISSNKIYDSVQEDIGFFFPNLRYMKFSSNHFQGNIPSSMGKMKSLEMLDMSSNNLSGKLPKTFLSGCYSLGFLKLSNNQFQGEIFPEHANLTSLSWLFLDGNKFNGSLGKGLLKSKNLFLIEISDNIISGMLPLWIGRMSRLEYLYMRKNQLKGHFPHQIHNLQQLEVIDISYNSFSGSIPKNLDFPSLTDLILHNNEFMGTIPNTLFEAEELRMLDLRNNIFSGMTLNTIRKRFKLSILLLRNNNLQGHIPKKICQVLSEVGILDLSHNKFKGVIPSCLGNMSFGAVRHNDSWSPHTYMSYGYPPLFQNWSYTSAFNLNDDLKNRYPSTPTTTVDFYTKSRYEAYQGDILSYMYGLDLSNNQLLGEIPVAIGNLKKILALNFSSNRLTGSIPESISKMKDLESLDLSNNKLDGNIPPQLAELDNLGYFDVAYNNLSGEIPFNGHFLTFDEKSYIGNAHLCGIRINKSCNPTRVPKSSASKQAKKEEDGVIDMVWFYWTCGAVYISTSLALFVFLCIDSRWSREWFYRVDLLVHHLQCFKDCFVCN